MDAKFEELQDSFDILFLQITETNARMSAFRSMVLGVYQESLPSHIFQCIYTKYVDTLEEKLNKAIKEMEEYFVECDCSRNVRRSLLRQQMDIWDDLCAMKRDPDYIQPASA
jgi:hypothetical protein